MSSLNHLHSCHIEQSQLQRTCGEPGAVDCLVYNDGKDTELLAALKQVVGHGAGTVLSCIPGELAYFEGEIPERFLLVRR